MPCFKNLPIELCDEILAIAAWAASESDRPWLCALATTSRRTLSIVPAILYDTVHLTWRQRRLRSMDRTFQRILAAAPAGHFGLTRNLWVDIQVEDWDKHGLAIVFPNLVHFAAESFAFLTRASPSFWPQRLTLFKFSKRDWDILLGPSALPPLRGITHLRLAITTALFGIPLDDLRLATLSPDLSLQYVILESSQAGWHAANLCGVVIPFFLSGATVRRLSICTTTFPMPEVRAALEMYANEHRERRLCLIDRLNEGAIPSTFRPGLAFDPAQWMHGRPLYDSDEL